MYLLVLLRLTSTDRMRSSCTPLIFSLGILKIIDFPALPQTAKPEEPGGSWGSVFHQFSRWLCAPRGTGSTCGWRQQIWDYVLRASSISVQDPASHIALSGTLTLGCGDEVGQGPWGLRGAQQSGAAGDQKLGEHLWRKEARGVEWSGAVIPSGKELEYSLLLGLVK